VIVGLATIVGIRAATENQTRANSDALIQDAVRIASDAQQWKKKPVPFGGQLLVNKADPLDWTGADFTAFGYPIVAANCYENINGQFSLTVNAGTDLTITGYSEIEDNSVEIVVTGVEDTNINQGVIAIGTAVAAPAGLAGTCP
jgi:hypothetical protein